MDQRARAEGTTIGTLRDVIPKACHAIDPRRSWTALAVAFARLGCALLILRLIPLTSGVSLLWQVPALAAAELFAGWCFTGSSSSATTAGTWRSRRSAG